MRFTIHDCPLCKKFPTSLDPEDYKIKCEGCERLLVRPSDEKIPVPLKVYDKVKGALLKDRPFEVKWHSAEEQIDNYLLRPGRAEYIEEYKGKVIEYSLHHTELKNLTKEFIVRIEPDMPLKVHIS